MEQYNIYLKKFKTPLIILVAVLVLFIVLISKTVPKFQKISNIQKEYKDKSTTLADSERKLEAIKTSEQQQEAREDVLLKAFFKPITQGLDTEAAVSDEFGEILQLVKENKIKTRSLKYDYDPADDNFVKNAASRFHVCKVTAEMIANYANFENFMRDLYKHEHFLEISKIEIIPYQKNKRILLINLEIKLYAQRDGSIPEAAPAPEPSPADETTH